MICFSFALSYLTGEYIDRDRGGTTIGKDNARLWRNWWAKAGPAFRVPAKKRLSTSTPLYPSLTRE